MTVTDNAPMLDQFTLPHVAFAAAELCAVRQGSTNHNLIGSQKWDIEDRYTCYPHNTNGLAVAHNARASAGARRLLDVHDNPGRPTHGQ